MRPFAIVWWYNMSKIPKIALSDLWRRKLLKAWKSLSVLAILALVLSLGIVTMSQGQTEATPGTIYVPGGHPTIQAAMGNETRMSHAPVGKRILPVEKDKSNLTEAQKKLSTDLLQLVNPGSLPPGQTTENLELQMQNLGQFRRAGSVSAEVDGKVAGDLVYVYIYLKPPAETRVIEPYVWEITDRDEENHLAVAWVEVNELEALASQEVVCTIRTVMPPLVVTGSVTTEGDAIHRTSDVRTTYSQNGSGMKVGIISNGVNHWTAARNSGDLPANLHVLSNTVGGDEGTAMLEIVYDMVPGADLYFHDCGNNTVAFNSAIDDLVAAGCDVICDDIGWIAEPFFEDGIVASHVASVLASHDIVYVSSAGNAGQRHYQGDYYPIPNSTQHDFSRNGTDYYLYLNMAAGSSVRIVLEWNDQFGSSGNDYDLYLYSYGSSSTVAASWDTQDGDDDPLEFISYTVPGGTPTGDYAIVVEKYSGAAKTLEVYIYPSGAGVYTNNINATDSIFGHPAVPGAIAAGAIDAHDSGHNDIESFSSRGPVTITYPSPESRPKPDLCGIDGVSVTGAGGFGSPFYGTSAAAPHIAAIAAQLWGAFPAKTGDEIRDILCSSAVDLGSAGFDNVFGYGRADALNAYGAIIPPTITSFAPGSPVNDTKGATRTFNITIDQTVNTTWSINGTPVQLNQSVMAAAYTNTSAAIGMWNVSVCASNANGSDMQTWIWNVTAPPVFNCTCGNICVNTTGWWRNGGTFNASATPIQDAVNNATGGETICVKDGNYHENVDVNTANLTIKSQNGTANCVVNATNSSDYVFDITANRVNITGFTVQNATAGGNAGIWLRDGVSYCNISSNNVTNNCHGIIVDFSSNNTLTGNIASSNSFSGIYIHYSSDNNLTGNSVSNNSRGIFMQNSSNNTLMGNSASSNDYGIYLDSLNNDNTLTNNTVNSNDYGIYLYSSSNNTIALNNFFNCTGEADIYCSDTNYTTISNNNTFFGNGVPSYAIKMEGEFSGLIDGNEMREYYTEAIYTTDTIATISNNHMADSSWGIEPTDSTLVIFGNTIENGSSEGIDVYGGANLTIYDNIITNFTNGIYCNDDSPTTLFIAYNNTITDCVKGILIESCNRLNRVYNNTLTGNDYGIYLQSSTSNTIYNNYFANTNNAWDNGNNTWNTTNTTGPNIAGGSYIGGNYWSDYAGNDTNGDGFGDTELPYNCTGNITNGGDYLPLIMELATLEGHVSFTGRGTAPNDKWIEDFVVKGFEHNNLTQVLWTANAITNNTGVFTIEGVTLGTYDVSIKNWTCLSEVVTGVTLTAGNTTVVDFGTTREGDSNNDDIITGADRSLLYSGWNKSEGEGGYNGHYDFNRDGSLTGADRSLMYAYWAQHGDLVS